MRDELPNEEYDDADTICVVSIARRVCGPAVARKLIRDFGGTRLFMPGKLHPDHPICVSVGVEQARAISAECFGVWCYVPNSADKTECRRAMAQLLAADGKTRSEIALAARCSERAIYRDFAALRARGIVVDSLRKNKAG